MKSKVRRAMFCRVVIDVVKCCCQIFNTSNPDIVQWCGITASRVGEFVRVIIKTINKETLYIYGTCYLKSHMDVSSLSYMHNKIKQRQFS